MDRTNTSAQQWTIPQGTDVYGADGDKVGSVVSVQPNYIVVEKGFFFPSDYYIPSSAVATYDDDRITLNVTKDEALHQGWDTMPTEVAPGAAGTYAAAAPTTTGGYVADMGATDATVGQVASAPAAATTAEDDTLRVPVREEELTATKRPVERGAVEVTKDVVTEQQQLEVPVTEERVRVERRAVDREVSADADAFQEGTIEVPVRGEEVQTQKRVVQTGEVDLSKEAVQRTERVADTVRREQVHVDQTGDVVTDATDDATDGPAGSAADQSTQRRRHR